MTTSLLPRNSNIGEIDPLSEDFSAFVFKIQANMNKAHRDRMAFMRICSGKFTKGMEVFHYQGNKKIKLNQSKQIMAENREEVEEAYSGDIIGVFDPGIFSIGDTICMPKNKFAYEGIPTFAPEHFAMIRNTDTMKRKQFVKGVEQIEMCIRDSSLTSLDELPELKEMKENFDQDDIFNTKYTEDISEEQ